MEGRVDDIARSDFGPNASFWETPVGQAIASFVTHGISSEIEEERRQYHSAILLAKEIDNQIDDILAQHYQDPHLFLGDIVHLPNL